ncbi:hypothetical protein HMPREF1544_02805 [Mucor circinelloides 1006PhL]|uniref:HMG box domain-containing protein n=1 Tax=Mucor circinelloides f. circinelloides (strain 1006PhL) TaxID=1220926 RepID=S2KD64_MUCC1|nr:hypothetical protein HMPREF1544_02805 [Mucor circinelloides 1006PhL]
MSLPEDNLTKSDNKKYQDYKKRIREIEEENDNITAQLAKARHHIKRLRVERIVLLEEIEDLRQVRPTPRSSKKSNGMPASAVFPSIGNLGADSDSEMSISESVISAETKGPRKNASATPRKKRDPNAPKGPGNVFFLYCRMERDNIKDEVPNESLGEVTRLLGQKWKALTKDQKQKYYDIYKKEQDEYEVAMKSYTAAGGGIEGAAAVEAAANKIKEEGGDDDDHDDKLDIDDEEEIDMLQDDDDEELDDEVIEDDEDDLMDGAADDADELSKPQTTLSPPPPSSSSHTASNPLQSTQQQPSSTPIYQPQPQQPQQHHLPPHAAFASPSSIATDQSTTTPMPET